MPITGAKARVSDRDIGDCALPGVRRSSTRIEHSVFVWKECWGNFRVRSSSEAGPKPLSRANLGNSDARRRALFRETVNRKMDYSAMLAIALEEARTGLAEGGLPIGAAILERNGKLIGSGHNRRVQNGDPSLHGETDAFRNAGRQRSYRNLIMVTTLAPCWYCSGLVRQFGFGTLVVGESRNFQGGMDWLRSLGINVIDLDSQECVSMMSDYIRKNPAVWHEDIGEE